MVGLWGMYAVDAGPRCVLESLASSKHFVWIDEKGNDAPLEQCERWLEGGGIGGLVVGTSRSRDGLKLENECRTLAKAAGRVTIAVEDYPGNGRGLNNKDVDILVVDNRVRYEGSSWGGPVILGGASMRYDSLRVKLPDIRKQYSGNRLQRRAGGIALWVGQPETDMCILTLSRVLGALEKIDVKLLFKAHPRDVGYVDGVYTKMFGRYSVEVVDVSRKSLFECFCFAPDIVLTHFSSCAIEAGFFGIPSVHLLYPDAGGMLLEKTCGYSRPPICGFGGSLMVADLVAQDELLEEVIGNESLRAEVMKRFDEFYDVNTLQAPMVIANILSCQAKFGHAV